MPGTGAQPRGRKKFRFKNKLTSFDWAKFRRTKGAIKLDGSIIDLSVSMMINFLKNMALLGGSLALTGVEQEKPRNISDVVRRAKSAANSRSRPFFGSRTKARR
jgi:hypothetical protein